MNIIIKRNDKLADRFIIKDENVSANEFTVHLVPDADMPKRPTESAGYGKEWRLDYVDGVLQYYTIDRALTTEERLTRMEEQVYPAWAAGVAYAVGAVVMRLGKLYRCIQAHTSQEDWAPEVVPALWVAV